MVVAVMGSNEVIASSLNVTVTPMMTKQVTITMVQTRSVRSQAVSSRDRVARPP